MLRTLILTILLLRSSTGMGIWNTSLIFQGVPQAISISVNMIFL
jgi:hypothetical protein